MKVSVITKQLKELFEDTNNPEIIVLLEQLGYTQEDGSEIKSHHSNIKGEEAQILEELKLKLEKIYGEIQPADVEDKEEEEEPKKEEEEPEIDKEYEEWKLEKKRRLLEESGNRLGVDKDGPVKKLQVVISPTFPDMMIHRIGPAPILDAKWGMQYIQYYNPVWIHPSKFMEYRDNVIRIGFEDYVSAMTRGQIPPMYGSSNVISDKLHKSLPQYIGKKGYMSGTSPTYRIKILKWEDQNGNVFDYDKKPLPRK